MGAPAAELVIAFSHGSAISGASTSSAKRSSGAGQAFSSAPRRSAISTRVSMMAPVGELGHNACQGLGSASLKEAAQGRPRRAGRTSGGPATDRERRRCAHAAFLCKEADTATDVALEPAQGPDPLRPKTSSSRRGSAARSRARRGVARRHPPGSRGPSASAAHPELARAGQGPARCRGRSPGARRLTDPPPRSRHAPRASAAGHYLRAAAGVRGVLARRKRRRCRRSSDCW